MRHGFYLFIDEAGDEGLDRVRPLYADGASEYFVLCGVLVRTSKYAELTQSFNRAKEKLGMDASDQVHFRDLDDPQKLSIISSLATFKFGLIAIVSNKRNMQGYRNLRCEAKNLEVIRGRVRPRRYHWFYNGLFRYLLERASSECRRWTYPAYGEIRSIKIVFSRRKEISYPQTKAYLYKLKSERHDRAYFNNRRQIDWSVVDIANVDNLKDKDEAGLQIADCAASAIYRSLDGSWFGNVNPRYLELLSGNFIRVNRTPRDHGFKLLPDNFRVPLSDEQRRAFAAAGYVF